MITIGDIKDLQREHSLPNDTALVIRDDEILFDVAEEMEVEPVEFDNGLKVRRGGVDAILLDITR